VAKQSPQTITSETRPLTDLNELISGPPGFPHLQMWFRSPSEMTSHEPDPCLSGALLSSGAGRNKSRAGSRSQQRSSFKSKIHEFRLHHYCVLLQYLRIQNIPCLNTRRSQGWRTTIHYTRFTNEAISCIIHDL
jgi:hypothetical protein